MPNVASCLPTIRERLEEHGWEVLTQQDFDAWWADDVWVLRSVWSPRDCVVCLTFLIDPEADIHNRKRGERVWAVKASASLPTQWHQAELEVFLILGQGWTDRLQEFCSELSKFRQLKDHLGTRGVVSERT